MAEMVGGICGDILPAVGAALGGSGELRTHGTDGVEDGDLTVRESSADIFVAAGGSEHMEEEAVGGENDAESAVFGLYIGRVHA